MRTEISLKAERHNTPVCISSRNLLGFEVAEGSAQDLAK